MDPQAQPDGGFLTTGPTTPPRLPRWGFLLIRLVPVSLQAVRKTKGLAPQGTKFDHWETEASGKILPAFSPRGLVLRGSLHNLE